MLGEACKMPLWGRKSRYKRTAVLDTGMSKDEISTCGQRTTGMLGNGPYQTQSFRQLASFSQTSG